MTATICNARVEPREGAARELSWHARGVPATLEYPAIPAWGLLKRAADRFPERTAIRYYEQEWTYGTLWEDSWRAAALFKDLGVRPGDRVGLLMPNVPEYIIALHGIWLAGGVAVAISPLMVAEEVSSLLAATQCRVVVTLDLLAPLLSGGDFQPEQTLLVTLCDRLPALPQPGCVWMRRKKTGHWRITDSRNLHSFNRELAARTPDNDPVQVPAHDTPAYIVPTGGTTDAPKAVVLSHGNLVANAWQQFHWVGGKMGEETVLAVLPFFHSYGLSACVMTGMAMAATLVLHHRFNSRAVLRLIERHRPTFFIAVPAMLAAMNDRLRRKRADLSSIRWCISGGAPLEPAVAEEFTRLSGVRVVEGYGLSEASPVTHIGPLDGSARPGTIGLPLPDTKARIVDAETGSRELPPGEVGELIIRGPQVMLGYWNNPDATARSLRGGWLYTGDLATRDEDG
ncbi:MAG: AMP-binding protein, partial [Planctomycetes bacterium]|nr:AMP-binding protein [Planctomycetota bacterium]